MNRTWLVFWRTYWGGITRSSYLVFTVGLPAFFLLVPVVGSVILLWVVRSVVPPTDNRPIGIVDHSGFFANPAEAEPAPVRMLGFGSRSEAESALEAGDIQGFYFIPEDYLSEGRIVLTYETAPSLEVDQMFSKWVNAQIRSKIPPLIEKRFTSGANIVHEGIETATAFSGVDYLRWGGIYLLIYFVQVAAAFTSNYMYGTIASEAHDRTIEILLSSVTPRQFLIGKFLGLLAVGMTQLGVWMIPGMVGVGWFLSRFGTEYLPFIFPWNHAALVLSTLLGAYVLFQVLAAAAGLLRISGGAGPQVFGVLEWAGGLGMVYATYFLPRNPDTALAVAGSLFPLTAPLVLLIRLVASEVPTWQIVLSQAILWGTVLAGVWSLGGLLRRNLVSYAPRFKVAAWVRKMVSQR